MNSIRGAIKTMPLNLSRSPLLINNRRELAKSENAEGVVLAARYYSRYAGHHWAFWDRFWDKANHVSELSAG